MASRSSFLYLNMHRFRSFIDDHSIESRLVPRIWAKLESMTCEHICPWCGVPCCGMKTCNDLYKPYQPPSTTEAKLKHSCQFHRDQTITGVHLISGYVDENNPGTILDTLPNYGACPKLIKDNRTILHLESNAKKVCIKYSSGNY